MFHQRRPIGRLYNCLANKFCHIQLPMVNKHRNGICILGLKGRHNSAQGIALGIVQNTTRALQGRHRKLRVQNYELRK